MGTIHFTDCSVRVGSTTIWRFFKRHSATLAIFKNLFHLFCLSSVLFLVAHNDLIYVWSRIFHSQTFLFYTGFNFMFIISFYQQCHCYLGKLLRQITLSRQRSIGRMPLTVNQKRREQMVIFSVSFLRWLIASIHNGLNIGFNISERPINDIGDPAVIKIGITFNLVNG